MSIPAPTKKMRIEKEISIQDLVDDIVDEELRNDVVDKTTYFFDLFIVKEIEDFASEVFESTDNSVNKIFRKVLTREISSASMVATQQQLQRKMAYFHKLRLSFEKMNQLKFEINIYLFGTKYKTYSINN